MSYGDPKFQIKRHIPRHQKQWEKDDRTRVREAKFYHEFGIVEVRTYPEDYDRRDGALTVLEMWLHPHVYICYFKRCYHDRHVPRIANRFAWRCHNISQGRES